MNVSHPNMTTQSSVLMRRRSARSNRRARSGPPGSRLRRYRRVSKSPGTGAAHPRPGARERREAVREASFKDTVQVGSTKTCSMDAHALAGTYRTATVRERCLCAPLEMERSLFPERYGAATVRERSCHGIFANLNL